MWYFENQYVSIWDYTQKLPKTLSNSCPQKWYVFMRTEIIEKIKNEYLLYINIPFCVTQCSYCHYVDNLKFGNIKIDNFYFSKLLQQLNALLSSLSKQKSVTVYFGGGTPSLLSIEQLLQIKSFFTDNNVQTNEVSIEIHPKYWNSNILTLGFFNRYSIGVQSCNTIITKKYKRFGYNPKNIIDIINSIYASSLKNRINIDFVFDEKIPQEDIEFVKDINVDSVVFYPNTKGRGKERLLNIYNSLDILKYNINKYQRLYNSNFILTKQKNLFSEYSFLQYEEFKDIVGIGDNSISNIETESFLCLYNDEYIYYKYRQVENQKLLSFIQSSLTGVRKDTIKEIDNKMFNFFVHLENNIYYIPLKNVIIFYDYLQVSYSFWLATEFIAVVGYGDTDINVIRHFLDDYLEEL